MTQTDSAADRIRIVLVGTQHPGNLGSAARAMRILAVPLESDPPVISGESGAAGVGCLLEVLSNPAYADFREVLELDKNSQILTFSTEGNTDPDWFRRLLLRLGPAVARIEPAEAADSASAMAAETLTAYRE